MKKIFSNQLTPRFFSILLLIFAFSALNTTVFGQKLHISGRVLDDDTGEGLPFSSITVIGKMEGTSTDMDGNFSIDVSATDSLCATMLGYKRNAKTIPSDTSVHLLFRLKEDKKALGEVVIRPDGYERVLLRRLWKNRRKNQIKSFDSFQCEEYTKVELDLHQIDKKLRNSEFLKPFAFVFQNIDSTSDEKPFLPAFMSETLANVYFTKGNIDVKKVYSARRTSGVNNPSIADFIQTMHNDIDVYDNWVRMVGKSFVSPFSVDGFGYYNYYLLDSAKMDGQKSYKIKFKPKRKQETTFYGDFWIADTSFAVVNVNMRMSDEVNINFVNRIIIYQDFEFEKKDKKWYPSKQKAVIDFAPTEDTPGLIGRKSISFKNYKVNDKETEKKIVEVDPEMTDPETLKKDIGFWEHVRHDSLSKSEKMVYKMVDSIKKVPLFKTYTDVVTFLSNGFYYNGPIGIGNIYNIYNQNPIQGSRIKLSLETSNDFSKKLWVQVFGAYGFTDQKFRFGGKFQYNLQKYPMRTIIGGGYRDEVDVTTANSEETLAASLLSGLVRRPLPQKLTAIQEGKVYLERWWTKGWMTRLTLLQYTAAPYANSDGNGGGLNFRYTPLGGTAADAIDKFAATEAIARVRYAVDERFIDGVFNRTTIGKTKYPRVGFTYTHGFKGVFNSNFQYERASIDLDHWFQTNPLGWTRYQAKVGKTFGTLPYLLLEVMPGNETYMIERNNFNTMNRFEFAADTYAQLAITHHFEGFFLNHIPLIRKLKWREVAYFKAVYGTMSADNVAANGDVRVNTFGTKLQAPSVNNMPFMEAGFGVENILKFVRVDFVWRLNYFDNPEAPKAGVPVPMVGLDFNF